jgi:nucleoside-diphosphate-sugar epimerase
MKAFVTGATGFIGSRVTRKLLERGYDVTALCRSRSGATALADAGAHPVPGDLADTEALRLAMRGCDVVYHVAGWYKLGTPSAAARAQAEAVNIEGARNVLSSAQAEGIPRVIYTSTVAVFGDTHGALRDESYYAAAPTFATEYDRTKWLAHYEVALPMLREGVPITIVMPGAAYGPGDPSLIGSMMRWFYLGYLPFVPGPDTVLTLAHVDDVAEGHILAAERGRAGESYILAGPAYSVGELYELWARVTNLPMPRLQVGAAAMRPLAPLAGSLGNYLSLPDLFTEEAIRVLGMTYLGSSAKAQSELGWSTRPARDGFAETFAALASDLGSPPRGWAARNKPALAALAAATGLAVLLRSLRRPLQRN